MSTAANPASIRPPSILDAALTAHKAGLCVIPPKMDGTKKPLVKWKEFQTSRPTVAQIRQWWGDGRNTGLIVICGKISGNLEMLEFETWEVYQEFKAAAGALGLGPLVARIEAGCSERAPRGGLHLFWRCATIAGNMKLADHPGELLPGGKHKPEVDIETRGEGGYVVVAPSYGRSHHTGNPYLAFDGSFASIAGIKPAERETILNLARSMDRMPEGQGAEDDPWLIVPMPGTPRGEVRVGDDFNTRATWDDVLVPHGWIRVHAQDEKAYWRRPGKPDSWSATTNHNGSDCLYIFTSSTVFPPHKSYSKLGAFTLLNHAGDFNAAVKALAILGFGPPPSSNRKVKDGKGGLGSLRGAKGAFEPSLSAPKAPKSTNPPADPQSAGWESLTDEEFGLLDMSKVESKEVRWLLKNRIPIGMFTLFAGEGGLGKSFAMLSIAAGISTGGEAPGGEGERFPLGDVIILTAEDDPSYAIKPRLNAMKADSRRVAVLGTARLPNGDSAPISLGDIDRLRDTVRRRPETRLIFADPIPSFLGRGIDDSKNTDVRHILEPLAEFAAEYQIALVGITHFNKTPSPKAVHRVMGSVAYSNVARATWCLVEDPETEGRRLMLPVKNNYSPVRNNGLAFTIVAGGVVEWEPECVTTSLNDVLGGASGKNPAANRGKAVEFLREILTGKLIPSDDVIAAAKTNGFGKNLVWEVKNEAGVRAQKEGFGKEGKWSWTIDAPAQPLPEKAPDFGPVPTNGHANGKQPHRLALRTEPLPEGRDSEDGDDDWSIRVW